MVIRKSYVYVLAYVETIMVGRESRSRVQSRVLCVKTSNTELSYMTRMKPRCGEHQRLAERLKRRTGDQTHLAEEHAVWPKLHLHQDPLCGPSSK